MPLDENVTQQQALSLLQQEKEHVELIVARDKDSALGSINTVIHLNNPNLHWKSSIVVVNPAPSWNGQ